MEQRVAVTCPKCRVSEQVGPQATVAICSGCGKLIKCVECTTCGNCFAALAEKKVQCPRCLNDVRIRKNVELPFAALAEHRATGVVPEEVRSRTVAAPESHDARWGGKGGRWLFGLVVVLLLGIAGAVIGLEVGGTKAVPCRVARARSTITSTVSRNAEGAYQVDVTGTTVNESSGTLRDIVVTWVVTYPDGSTGRPTASSLPNHGTIARGAAVRWTTTSSSATGHGKPTGARVLQTYTTLAQPSCLT